MKVYLSIFLAVIMLCLPACGTRTAVPAATTELPAETTAAATTAPIETTESATATETVLPLAEETATFSFLSGAGGWSSDMTLNRDGSFSGQYHDSEMGEAGEGYPMGTVYICNFSGKFEDIQQIDAYSYKMTLTQITTEHTAGEEWIEGEIRYVASDPYGLADPFGEQECREFIFYLPQTPIDQVSEDFLSWWPYRYSQETEPRTELSCCGILNVVTGHGFFNIQ